MWVIGNKYENPVLLEEVEKDGNAERQTDEGIEGVERKEEEEPDKVEQDIQSTE